MIFLTGANGFLGSHLQDKVSGFPIPHRDISNIILQPYKNFFFLSTYGNMAYHTDEDEMIKANLLDLIHVLKESRGIDFESFVYVSSSSVKLKTQTTYSRLKKAAEELLLAYMERHNKPICIIRPYSITGVGEQKEHLIPTLIHSCFTGELVNFVPEPKHDWIDVDDVVQGILNLSKNRARGIFELGTGKSYSNQEVLDIVEMVTGRKANINIVKSMRDYDNDTWVSTNFRSRSFGWSPKKELQQSIVEMVKNYKQKQ